MRTPTTCSTSQGVHTLFDVAQRTQFIYKLWDPVSSLLLEGLTAGVVVGIVRGDRALRDRHVFALAACAAAFLGILSQLKFYIYHWGMVVGPATLVATNLALDSAALMRWRMPSRSPVIAPLVVAANLLAAFALTGRCASKWLEEVSVTIDWLAGRIDREQFASAFEIQEPAFKFHDVDRVALWLRENTASSDEVAVRGFEPEIYALAARRYGGRFFWTSFLTDPHRAYRRDEWLAQDRAQLGERMPRWVVALAWVHEGPDAPEYVAPLGYVVRKEMFEFVIMERVDPAAAH